MLRLRRLLPAAALLAAAAFPTGAAASANQQSIIQDDPQLKANPVATLATFRELGVDRVRVTLNWSTIAPNATSRTMPAHFNASDPAAYPAGNWAPYDKIVRYATAEGLGLNFMIAGPAPRWAEGAGEPAGGPFGVWKPSVSQFGAFVAAVGRRYSGGYRPSRGAAALPRVSFWSIWNEPNYGQDLAPQAISHDSVPVSAGQYRGLVAAAWGSLAATGHTMRHDTILIGETAPRGFLHPIGNFGGMKPLPFLLALYCVNSGYYQLRGSAAAAIGCPTTAAGSRRFRAHNPALFQASGFADHPYASQSNPQAPTVPTSNTPGLRADHQYADLPELGYLEGLLDRVNRVYGSASRFAIWDTEYGYRTRPPDRYGVSQATAAYYENWAEYLSWKQSRVASFTQYQLVDSSNGSFASGLELPGGAHKATFDAFRMPLYMPFTSERRGTRLEVWGDVRPAYTASGRQQVQVQFQRGSRGAFATVQTVRLSNARGYFDTRVGFAATGSVRLMWTDPTRQRIYSRTQQITVR
ncbi:MAG: hypothetical protein JO168_27215 [Solirubrobacterales bacterium]|nr:hypothetical protein [Solirubrobacterales bacterium]